MKDGAVKDGAVKPKTPKVMGENAIMGDNMLLQNVGAQVRPTAQSIAQARAAQALPEKKSTKENSVVPTLKIELIQNTPKAPLA